MNVHKSDAEAVGSLGSVLKLPKKIFLETEGIDIYSAPAVALASLIKMKDEGRIDPSACIMLNITGAGEELMFRGKELHYLKPDRVFPLAPDAEQVIAAVEAMFE